MRWLRRFVVVVVLLVVLFVFGVGIADLLFPKLFAVFLSSTIGSPTVIEHIPFIPKNQVVIRLESDTPGTVDQTVVEVRSEIPGVIIQPGSLDQDLLFTFFQRIGRWPLKNVPFIGTATGGTWQRGGTLIVLHKITVIFKPLEQYAKDAAKDPNVRPNRLLVQSKGSSDIFYLLSGTLSSNQTELTIPLYVSLAGAKSTNIPLNDFFSNTALLSIYVNLHTPPIEKEGNPAQVMFTKVGVLGKPILKLLQLTSDLFPMLKEILVPAIYAVNQCQGSITCGTYHGQSGTCSLDNGRSCTDDSNCVPLFGTCNITQQAYCDYDAGGHPGNCSQIGTQQSCQANCGTCTQGGCSWQGGGSCTVNGMKPTENGGAVCCSGCEDGTTKVCISCGGGPPSTPTPGGGPAGCNSPCSSNANCAGLGVNPACVNGACYDQNACGINPTPKPNVQCGGYCTQDSDCTAHAGGVVTSCSGHTCINRNCDPKYTQWNAFCYCNAPVPCGNQSGAAFGLACQGNSANTYVNAVGGACTATTPVFCIGSANPAYTRKKCTSVDTGNYYMVGPGGKDTGFDQAATKATCACENSIDPLSTLNYPLMTWGKPGGDVPLNGAVINATWSMPGLSVNPQGSNEHRRSYSVSFRWGNGNKQLGGFQTLEWDRGTTVYELQIVPKGKDCSDPAAICIDHEHGIDSTIRYNDYTFAPKFNGDYMVHIRIYDPFCPTTPPSDWTGWYSFTVTGLPVTGTVALDNGTVVPVTDPTNPNNTMCVSSMGGRILVVNAPGLYGEYYNTYPSDMGPPPAPDGVSTHLGSQEGDEGYPKPDVPQTYLGGSPRTRYDSADGSNGAMGFFQNHGFLEMPGSQDGSAAVRWTGYITATDTQQYYLYTGGEPAERVWLDFLDGKGPVLEHQFNWPDGSPNVGVNGKKVMLTKGKMYKLTIVVLQEGINGSLTFNYWHPDASNPNTFLGFGMNDTFSGLLPGVLSTVAVSDANLGNSAVPVAPKNANGQLTGQYAALTNTEFTGGGSLTLKPSSAYTCTCPVGCAYLNLTSPAFGKDIYVGKTPNGWMQAQGGDVVSCGDIESPVSDKANPRQFVLNGTTGGFPGIVSYPKDNSFNFDSGVNTGANYVSSTNWLVQELPKDTCTNDWFQYFENRFDVKVLTSDFAGGTLAKPPTRKDSGGQLLPYKSTGITTSVGNWAVATTDSLVIFVYGNLKITGPITITGNGFVAFVVSGSITVSSAIGNAAGNVTPNIQGIFITGGDDINSIFHDTDGTNPVAAHMKLVIKGTTIANTFDFNRDFTLVGGANSEAAILFIYDPNLIMNLPSEFKDVPIHWMEVAP